MWVSGGPDPPSVLHPAKLVPSTQRMNSRENARFMRTPRTRDSQERASVPALEFAVAVIARENAASKRANDGPRMQCRRGADVFKVGAGTQVRTSLESLLGSLQTGQVLAKLTSGPGGKLLSM